MTSKELRIFREAAWDSGWNAAMTCALAIVEGRKTAAGAGHVLIEVAAELRAAKVGDAKQHSRKGDSHGK